MSAEYDKGAIVGRMQVTIEKHDTPEKLQKRMLPVEHKLQIDVLQRFANGTVEEFSRVERLVRDGEEQILEDAKKQAIVDYPNG